MNSALLSDVSWYSTPKWLTNLGKRPPHSLKLLENSLGPPGSLVDHDEQVDVAFTGDGERAHQVHVCMGEFPPGCQDGLRAGVGMLVDFCTSTVLATSHPFSNVCSYPRPDKTGFNHPLCPLAPSCSIPCICWRTDYKFFTGMRGHTAPEDTSQ